MRRNCNLTLRLLPPCSNHRQEEPIEEVGLFGEDGNPNRNENQNQITIFYDGKISVSEVTDIQARAIIKLASEELEEKWRSKTPGSTTSSEPPSLLSPSLSPSSSPNGLSMKRSLQRFLQKRKHRIQTTSPYHH